MTRQYTLFTKVQDYYANLTARLHTAQKAISMTCLAFEDGYWPGRIKSALIGCAARGIPVHLMVDQLGQISDEPRTLLTNNKILNNLQAQGVRVDVFRPTQPGLSIRNRMHCKFCAIDDDTLFIGGSNIGDYYTRWSDTNLRVDGGLGLAFHSAYDYLHGFSLKDELPNTHQPRKEDAPDHLLLTIPNKCTDIRQAILDLILNADRSIHLRTWYFLPDETIMDALCSQAEKGVQVNVLLSHKTRVRPVDLANLIPIHRLVSAGGWVFRYRRTYMHAKVAWNDKGTILLGSANLDAHSMFNNFESCLSIQNDNLARKLQVAFNSDLSDCQPSTPASYKNIPFPEKILSHACNLASSWL
jgi:cardiolipin synthase